MAPLLASISRSPGAETTSQSGATKKCFHQLTAVWRASRNSAKLQEASTRTRLDCFLVTQVSMKSGTRPWGGSCWSSTSHVGSSTMTTSEVEICRRSRKRSKTSELQKSRPSPPHRWSSSETREKESPHAFQSWASRRMAHHPEGHCDRVEKGFTVLEASPCSGAPRTKKDCR